MMRVSVQNDEGLWKQMTVLVPAERLEKEFGVRLQKFKHNARIDGFRPGKAPSKLIEERYGEEAFEDAVGELIYSTCMEALSENKLQPAGQPKIEPKRRERGQDLEYVARFEVFPEIAAPTLAGCTIEKVVGRVEESDVNSYIEYAREYHATWHTVERAAGLGDRVTLNISAIEGGKTSKETEQRDWAVILEETEEPHRRELVESLMSAKAGENRNLKMQDYRSDENSPAGKVYEFNANVVSVEEKHLAEVDDSFFELMRCKDKNMDALRKEFRTMMENGSAERTRSMLHQQALVHLLERNSVQAPKQLVEDEMHDLLEKFRHMAEKNPQFEGPVDDATREQVRKEAERRVCLHLLLRKVVEVHSLSVTEEDMRQRLHALVSAGPGNPKEVLRWYMEDESRLMSVRSSILERHAVEAIIATAEIKEKFVPYNELMSENNEDTQVEDASKNESKDDATILQL